MEMNMKKGIYTYYDESYEFNFYSSLSIHDKAIFVRNVVDAIVDDVNYDFVLRDSIFDYTIISMFTDIDISFLNVVDSVGNKIINIDMLEDFLLSTNIVEIIKANVSSILFDELNNAIDKAIQYRTGIHPSPIADSISSLLSTLEKKINEVDLTNMAEMVNKFASMTGELTPESIMNAYINSDMHKNNLAEIEESKKEPERE